jgi:hypothetical protein
MEAAKSSKTLVSYRTVHVVTIQKTSHEFSPPWKSEISHLCHVNLWFHAISGQLSSRQYYRHFNPKMEAARSYETLISNHHTTRSNDPQNHEL